MTQFAVGDVVRSKITGDALLVWDTYHSPYLDVAHQQHVKVTRNFDGKEGLQSDWWPASRFEKIGTFTPLPAPPKPVTVDALVNNGNWKHNRRVIAISHGQAWVRAGDPYNEPYSEEGFLTPVSRLTVVG